MLKKQLSRCANVPAKLAAPLLVATFSLVACGGGGDASPPSTPSPAAVTSQTFASVQVTIPASTYASGSPERGAWDVLQQARVLCGFGALRQNTRLDAAALAHAKYQTHIAVTTTPLFLSHYEDIPDDPFYTGFAPWHRTLAQGYGDQVAEILEAINFSYDVSNPPPSTPLALRGAASMRNLMNTVYHLTGAMFAGADVGFGADIQTAVSGTSRREEYRFGSLNGFQTQLIRLGAGTLATYPCNNSINVPIEFFPAFESPNPFPSMTSPLQLVGPPIYLKVDAGQALTLNTRSVVSSTGISVPTTVLTAANDAQAEITDNEIFVVPDNALSPDTRYQVDLSGTIRNTRTGAVSPFNRSFSMVTEP